MPDEDRFSRLMPSSGRKPAGSEHRVVPQPGTADLLVEVKSAREGVSTAARPHPPYLMRNDGMPRSTSSRRSHH